jgi:hypothetical protein
MFYYDSETDKSIDSKAAQKVYAAVLPKSAVQWYGEKSTRATIRSSIIAESNAPQKPLIQSETY